MGGHARGIEGGLYGYKTELLESLRSGDVPRWLSPDHPTQGGAGRSIERSDSRDAFLRKWRDEAEKRNRQTWVVFAVKGAPQTQVRTGGLQIAGRSQRHQRPEAPGSIRERCEEYLDSWGHKEEMASLHDHTGRFAGFMVRVEVGKRGGINDVSLSAQYKS